MAPKNRNTSATSRAPAPTLAPQTLSSSVATSSNPSPRLPPSRPQNLLNELWQRYLDTTSQRVKQIDAFMTFLVVVGGLQFVYCAVAGNYPFNAFLAGFSATVGQFVLTASLRMQTNPDNREEFSSVPNERAFADYIFGSLLLHFFCVNFIN